MRGYNKGNPREWVPVNTKVFPVTGVLSRAEMPGKDPFEKGCYYSLYKRGLVVIERVVQESACGKVNKDYLRTRETGRLAEVARASREAGDCDLAPMDIGEDAP
jgi:hypothetical protein